MIQPSGLSGQGQPDSALIAPLTHPIRPGLPTPRATLDGISTPAPDALGVDPLNANVQDVLPGAIRSFAVASPASELPPTASLDTIVGAVIGPASPPLQKGPILAAKAGTSLRLPSFESLGIANPRPNHVRPPLRHAETPIDSVLPSLSSSPAGTHMLGPIAKSLATDGSSRLTPPVARPTRAIEILTPPEDGDNVLWGPMNNVADGPSNDSLTIPASKATPTARAAAQDLPTPESAGLSGAPPVPRIDIQRTHSDTVRSSWLGDASNRILANVEAAGDAANPLKILSHALPCPSPSGFAFPYIISSLQMHTPGSPLCWISVFHALPGRFSIRDVPSSPPSTPDPPVGGQDYFTSKTFDSAVPVLDYQDNLTTMPRSPHPIVPPSTIGVSIIERYIPPTNAIEFSEMFNVGGRSLLVDRLVEISPDHGSLLFIYPTKTGAETFTQHYLSPLLDPMLRSMITMHRIPMEMAQSLGSMPAISSMLEYNVLKSKLELLCQTLSQPGSRVQRMDNRRSKYVLEMSRSHQATFERSVWAEKWWAKQEKTRIRDTINLYLRSGRRSAEMSEFAPTSMLHSLLDGVVSKPYPDGIEPTEGIEVGVFLIKRILV